MRSEKVFSLVLRTLLKVSGHMASSWVLPWCVYRLHGIRLIGPPGEEIWYFAYGADMRPRRVPSRAGSADKPAALQPYGAQGQGHLCQFMRRSGCGGLGRPLQDHPPRPRSSGGHRRRSVGRISATLARCRRPWRHGASGRNSPKAFRGEDIGRIGSMSKTLAARCFRPQLSWLKAMTTTAPPRFDTSHCCGRAHGHTGPA